MLCLIKLTTERILKCVVSFEMLEAGLSGLDAQRKSLICTIAAATAGAYF